MTAAKTETAPKTLAQKINQLQLDMEPMEKKGRVKSTNVNYSYITAETMFATMQGKLARAGILIIPSVKGVQYSSDGRIVNGLMEFSIENVDIPGDVRIVPWVAQAPANDDKGASKFETTGIKYFLKDLFLISDEEDPDAMLYDDEAARIEQLRADVLAALQRDEEAAALLTAQTGKSLAHTVKDMSEGDIATVTAKLVARAKKAAA